MCLILFAHRCHPHYRLVVAANRDEFHQRASAPAGFWSDRPDVLAGRDLEAGGTWLGITRDARFAAVTNYREPGRRDPAAQSRGALVGGFLAGPEATADYLAGVAADADRYNGFALVADDGATLGWYSNRGPAPAILAPGIHGLCNHLLDTPWPKLVHGRDRLRALLATGERLDPDRLLELLDDREPAPADALPATGLDHEWESALSALFVSAPGYGTRCSTVVLVGHDGRVDLVERSFDERGAARDDRRFSFDAAPRSGAAPLPRRRA